MSHSPILFIDENTSKILNAKTYDECMMTIFDCLMQKLIG